MNKETKEKTCAFYASDYHFEMISLPFIERNLAENKEIIVLTENNLEDTIKIIIEKVNLQEKNKSNILKINWNNDDLEKFKQIKNNIENNKNITIFIKGKSNYIKNINNNIEKWTKNNNKIKIIDCYDIEEVESNLNIITSKYKNVLSTAGERKIENL